MKKAFLALLVAGALGTPAFPQPVAQPAPVAVTTAPVEGETAVAVPENAPKGSSGPTAVGVGMGVAAVAVIFGIMALGAVFAMGSS
jgi:hypothetical protein